MTYRKSFELPCTPKDAFSALTEPNQLTRWFAEQVDIDLRVGGRYRFWGQHTLWVPNAESADQRIRHLEAERALDFSWTWRGCESRVELRLTAVAGGTRLDVCHGFSPTPDTHERKSPLRSGHTEESEDPERDHDLIVDAFWDLSVENLRHYLQDRAPFLLPLLDGSREVKLAVVIRATPKSVFQALTSHEGLIDWMGADQPEVDLRKGGTFSYGWLIASEGEMLPAGPRRVLDLIPNQLLVHDWFWPDEAPSQVRWELQPIASGTRLELTHSGFDEEPASYKLGWASGLSVLVQQLEGKDVSSWLSQDR